MTSSSPESILSESGIAVHPDEFAFISVGKEDWWSVLSNSPAGPNRETPYFVFDDGYEITLLLGRGDLENSRTALGRARIDRGWRLLTFTAPMGFEVVGFLALVAKILAVAGISMMAVSSFSRDHVLVKQKDLTVALEALSPHVKELC